MQTSEVRERVIVALDFPSARLALEHVDRLEGRAAWVKVGLELFMSAGAGIVETLTLRGLKVFLDLKLHDIPNTVAGAVRVASSTGATLLTVHAAGGRAMLAAAAETAADTPGAPRLLAVTVLTSMNAEGLRMTGVVGTPSEQVLRLAGLARVAGIGGLVCSPEEVQAVRREMGAEALLVVPGIRPAGAARADQSRVAGPAEAMAAGASMLVVGRPITQAADPGATFDAILAEMAAVGV